MPTLACTAAACSVRAARGTLLACLPPSTSVPPGYRPNRVHEYLVITVPGIRRPG